MDVTKPKLQTIGDMCFRRLDIPNDGIIDDLKGLTLQQNQNQNQVIDNSEQNEDHCRPPMKTIGSLEDSDDTEDIIKDVSGGKGTNFKAELKIAKFFHRHIIGSRGEAKRNLEYESRCRIQVPTETDLSGTVDVIGRTIPDVKFAINKLDSIIKRARSNSDFTHFLSIPFNQNPIIERFIDFQKQVLDKQMSGEIDESLFQNKNQLHLTITPLLLTDQNERNIASKILEDCYLNHIKPLISGQPIKIKLQGIDYFNDDPTQVYVLFARVHDISDNPCLQSIVNYIFERFEEKGLIGGKQFGNVNPDIKVKLHVTLMNTSFRQSNDEGFGGRRGGKDNRRGGNRDRVRPKPFNVSDILNQFKDFYFGEIEVQTIEISTRHTNGGNNGYYSHISRIEF